MYTAVQDTPIVVDFLTAANDTGWSVDGNIATHTSCNSGNITLLTYPLIAGHTYKISYSVLSIAGGYVQPFAGDTGGIQRTTTGIYVENILAAGTSPVITYFSNANCSIQEFNIQDTINDTNPKQTNTLCYSALVKKWSDFRTFSPDFGFSLFIHTYTLYQGDLYEHANNSNSRNNFYGTQYDTIFKFVDNKQPQSVKVYNSIALQSNELMVTTTEGITTSLGQISELSDLDFIKDVLDDGVTSVNVTSVEGIFSASFWKNINSPGGLINGDDLRGNYLTVELITTVGSTVLQLFSVGINTSLSKIGVR